ncbi:hypothetical protein [Helicobacter bilis]|uniref:Uncharacterized protein n=1 Tax=Helicobacter bilis TaxID=37372 RepID=A0A4U8UAH5_9HELI|nr:hypothetical protein [Helicobacter bilis]TLE11712.1 hypothetical protein LS79_002345 [Helicobacter bilis]
MKGLNKYNKIEGYKYRDILDNQIKPAIAKHFKPILDKLKTAENKKQMQQIIMQNREGLSDYLAFNIAKGEHKDIDGYLTGDIDFYDKDVVKFFKHREDKQASKIYDDIRYRVLASIENLQDKNTSIHLFFDDLEGNSGHYKTYPRKKDLALDNVTIGSHFKEAMLISSKDTNLKEKIIEKLKDEYLDTELYKDYLEFCINSMKRYEPEKSKSNSVTQKTELTFGGGIHKEWNPQKLKAWEKELENVSQKIKDTQEVEKGISALKGETSLESATQKADSNDIIFTDKKGKEHTLTKEVQEQWLKTFNLKSLDESYIPKHSDEIREALGGKEIKLQLGSLKKLVAQGREQYIPQIKEVLDSPEAILKDSDNAFLFAKHLKE